MVLIQTGNYNSTGSISTSQTPLRWWGAVEGEGGPVNGTLVRCPATHCFMSLYIPQVPCGFIALFIIQSHLGFNLPPAWDKKGSGNSARVLDVELLCTSRGTDGQQEK